MALAIPYILSPMSLALALALASIICARTFGLWTSIVDPKMDHGTAECVVFVVVVVVMENHWDFFVGCFLFLFIYCLFICFFFPFF